MPSARRGCLFSVAKVYLTGALLVALVAAGTWGFAWWSVRREAEAWTRELGPERLAAAVPPRAEPNETTRRAQELVEPLDIDLFRKRPLTPELKAVVAFVVSDEGATEDDEVRVPEAVRAVLETHADRLAALETLLTESDPPTWASDPDLYYYEPAPPAEGPRALWALLLAHARLQEEQGGLDATRLALDAAGRLQAGLQGRTQPVFAILAAALSTARSSVRRRMREDLGDAEGAVGSLRAQFLASYGAEALMVTRHQQRHRTSLTEIALAEGATPPVGLRAEGERLLTSPYLRWCAADYSRHVRTLVGQLSASDPCHVDTAALDRTAMARVSRWSTFARILLSTAATRFGLVAEAELADELTRVVVLTRRASPEEPDVIASRACGGLEWHRLPDGKGGVLVAASGVARLPKRPGDAPWRYHVRPSSKR